jgi:uncharacterized membrane protein
MRQFVIFTITIHAVGVLLLLNRLGKQKYPITTEATANSDVIRVTVGLIWIMWGMWILKQ